MTIKITKEQKIEIGNAGDLYPIMQQILLRANRIDRNKEHFWLVALSAASQIILIELVSLGTGNMNIINPVDIFSLALQKQAASIILVHNHPAGTLQPSMDDISFTDRMVAVGKFLNVPVTDHLIITETGYYSFVNHNMLRTSFDLSFKEIDDLREGMEDAKEVITELMDKLKGERMAIAKTLLQEGVAIDIIVKASGLRKEEIEKLK